jgi:A/G-specific adenine glycosylase
MKRLAPDFAAPASPQNKNQKKSAASSAMPSIDGLRDPFFSQDVIVWQKQHGRHALPWQNTRDAYRVWLSEIMLQQTQVAAVIPYYLKFVQRFPTVQSLASAPVEDMMSHWSGLGYYTRARNLHKCAQAVVAQHDGIFPSDPELLEQLPGIGRSTAAAIAAFSYGARAAIMDGNVKRVFARVFGIDRYPGEKQVEDAMWLRAVALLPEHDVESYTQGLMDLGATLCVRRRPDCHRCPLAQRCVAYVTRRTDELPVRKPKKAMPERQTAMLVVTDGGRVLLQQRPDAGIWGGLLSLPELPLIEDGVAEDVLHAALAPFGTAASIERLPMLSHTFTHFKLHISPYQLRLAQVQQRIAETGHVWYAADALRDAPLPAPVKKLLLAVFREPDLLSGQ